jgi:iron complex outermembrane recepter protein
MVYYTYSQGFRPGGLNQNGYSEHATGSDGQWQYSIPASYLSDQLTNNEVGWKTEFFNHRLQWNGAVYQENWNNVQISFFDPSVVGNIFYDTNGQNFRVRGLETSLVARIAKGLTFQAAASWNQSVQTNSPALIDDNPLSVNFGKAITCIGPDNPPAVPCAVPVANPFGAIGSPSADAPPLQYSGRIRYEWVVGGYTPFAQFNATHQGISFTQAGSNPNVAIGGALSSSRSRFENPAYSTYDAAIGVAKDAWILTLNAQNLRNSNASTFISADQFIIAQTPLRPRVIGLSFDYKF